MPDVLVAIVPTSSAPSRSELATLGFGQQVAASLQGAVDVLVLGPHAETAANEAARYGARKVLVGKHTELEQPTGEALAAAIGAVAAQPAYRLIAAPTATTFRDCMPRLAARLGAPMASDVLEIRRADADVLGFTKPCFSGNLLAEIELRSPQGVATCRPSAFEPPDAVAEASAIETVALPERLAHPRKTFVEINRTELERPELTEADVVVSGGRGTRGAEGFKVLEELADLLGAAIGASRAVVDAGWMPNDFQVGQTGKIIAPKLYIGCGISGAIQHLAGMRNSKTIVAINKDPNAPIFEVADIGLVADLFDAVPRLVAAIKAARGA